MLKMYIKLFEKSFPQRWNQKRWYILLVQNMYKTKSSWRITQSKKFYDFENREKKKNFF